MTNYRYQYQPRRKYVCPNCNRKTLKRFIDTTTGDLLPDDFGVCERLFNCGYEKRPNTEKVNRPYVEPKILAPFYFDSEIMEATLNRYENNVLFKFLCKKFNRGKVTDVFNRYKVGTNECGDAIFWQINQSGKIVAGKKIQYFSDGHRNKAKGASWLHNQNGFDINKHELKQCLFGSHLINDYFTTLFVVESEKTALICEIVKKEKNVLFLATGGLQNLGLISKLAINENQKILCIPDNDGNKIWQEKIDKLQLNASIEIITALQEMKPGSDISDLIINILK